jgi:hypothetical protein
MPKRSGTPTKRTFTYTKPGDEGAGGNPQDGEAADEPEVDGRETKVQHTAPGRGALGEEGGNEGGGDGGKNGGKNGDEGDGGGNNRGNNRGNTGREGGGNGGNTGEGADAKGGAEEQRNEDAEKQPYYEGAEDSDDEGAGMLP